MMQKEKFTDNTYSVAKALTHIHIAKQYFDDVRLGASQDVKMIFTQYVNKCEWILDNLRHRLNEENRNALDKELKDSIVVDAITDKVVLLDNKSKDLVEEIIDMIIKGEEVKIYRDDTK
jgi:hypothetical protein